ncbi:MAG: NTP transferase domain-containing protein [Gemmatimonadota bacterium]|nr:NTP transferase domain-containing protein [Gemmatimonadota bacterium]
MSMTLVILAAGRGSRYGGLKQLEPVGPHEATLMDYTIHDAVRAGVDRVVLVIPHGLDAVFLSHLGEQFGRQIDIRCIAQTIEAVPYGYSIPPERAKPWGTAHAVLITAPLVDGPFLVANADDFYGASSYALLCTHLREHPNVAAVVGYPLHATLSPHGGVSRGICELDPNGFVARVREVRHIRDVQGVLEGRTEAGDRLTLSGNETVSMNLWGFGSAILPILESDFSFPGDGRGGPRGRIPASERGQSTHRCGIAPPHGASVRRRVVRDDVPRGYAARAPTDCRAGGGGTLSSAPRRRAGVTPCN